MPVELGIDEVEIQTASVDLNFRVSLAFSRYRGLLGNALGRFSCHGYLEKHDSKGVPLGLDTTAIIRRVGPNVSNVVIGDRIFALAPHGCITDMLVLPASLTVKLPDLLSFEDAATIPCYVATAIHSLLNVGGMTKD